MKSNENEILVDLIKLLKELYAIIILNSQNDVNYGKRTLTNMVQYLEMTLVNDKMEYEQLISDMAEQYKSMFPPRGGLSEFYIWDDNYEIRFKANYKYEQIKSKIEALFNNK